LAQESIGNLAPGRLTISTPLVHAAPLSGSMDLDLLEKEPELVSPRDGGTLAQPQLSPRRRQNPINEGPDCLDNLAGVGSAQYVRPFKVSSSKATEQPAYGEGTSGNPHTHNESLRSPYSNRRFKTEQWREKGVQRWPKHAQEHTASQPFQFKKTEEIVPLQRNVVNHQGSIPGEIWCRSLRTKALNLERLAKHNTNVATTTLSSTFDGKGKGWAGKTNSKSALERPAIHEWVCRPVAVGNLALDHMGGSRYAMDLTPRPCVPNSMLHTYGGVGVAPKAGAPNSAR